MSGADVSYNECVAARHLHAEGWSIERLAAVLEHTNITMAIHVNDECDHEIGPELDPRPAPELPPEEIRRRRARANLTVADLASEVGVTRATVSYWERGMREPRPHHARALDDALTANGGSA